MSDSALLPDKNYFTISEVGEHCQIKPYTLRYWEKKLPAISPQKHNKRRLYSRSEVEIIKDLKVLITDHGYTIEGAWQQLNISKKKPSSRKDNGAGELVTRLDKIIALLKQDD
jgi:DNA-binding transcriptional MerR regulator